MPQPLVAGPLTLTSVANSVDPPGTAIYTGTVTGGAANAFAGMFAQIINFPESTGSNNSAAPYGFLIVNSSAVAVTVQNPNAVASSGQTATLNVFTVNPAGPYSPSTNSSGAAPPFVNPPSTGLLYQENAPSGASLTPRAFEDGWNFTNSQLSTQRIVSSLVSAANDGIAFNYQTPVTPGTAPNGPCVGLKTDVQTTPSAPTGSFVQQGVPQISNSQSVVTSIAGQNPANIPFVQWQGGYQAP
jgi:hypothetical protein